MRLTRLFFSFCLSILLISGLSWADEGPVGAEFQVNTYSTEFQYYPSVTVGPMGEFVVVWQSRGSNGSDSSHNSVQGQRFGPDGSVVGDEFQVNTFTTGSQSNPDVGFEDSGDFVVVWDSEGSFGDDSSSYSVQGQRFHSDGTEKGAEFQVNTYTSDFQGDSAVAVVPGGDFVVVWLSYESGGTDSDRTSIQGQRFNSEGSAEGSQFQVNTYTTDRQKYPVVATDSNGDFVVVWENNAGGGGTDTEFGSIQGQRFASDGLELGVEFQVNVYTTEDQRRPSIAMQATGEFVVAWWSDGSSESDSSETSIQACRFGSDGSAIGSDFQVNTYTTSVQVDSSVTIRPSGAFVVAWESIGSPGSDNPGKSVQGQLFSSGGDPEGEQFQVNTYTTSEQKDPAVGVTMNGDFVVVWGSQYSSGPDSDDVVLGQRFHPNIFVDGFESGDTAAWSATSL